MRKHFFISLLFTLPFVTIVKAQSLDSLSQIKKPGFTVYYSKGHQPRAATMAARIEKAIAFHHDLLGFKPTVTFLILSAPDWKVYTTEGAVYGMPHYSEKSNRLIVAAEDNAFWKSFLPPLNELPENLRGPIQTTYAGSDGNLTMQPFFDLLAIHELGHAFHMQGGLTMQRTWMGELFCNMLLHTYIAEKEPEQWPALSLFPRMVVSGGSKGFKYTTLADIQEHYGEIARQHPRNYGWYQCRWHSAAAAIYDAGGKAVLRKLWEALKTNKKSLTDDELVIFLQTKADKSIADIMINWDRDTIR